MGALAAGLLFPSFASADPIIIDTIEQNQFVNWWSDYTYTHNINDDGFVLGSATGGTLEILISDDGGFLDSFEALLFIVEGFDFDTGQFSFGTSFFGALEVSALGALNKDGLLDITVPSLWGDFYVGNSTLTVYTSIPDFTSIPEPGALGLLCLGLVAMGTVRRRQKA
jgi:hypothetical protein